MEACLGFRSYVYPTTYSVSKRYFMDAKALRKVREGNNLQDVKHLRTRKDAERYAERF